MFPERLLVVSTDGLLDAHEVAMRARVDELREEVVRVAAVLGEAELALEHVAITRATLALVIVGHVVVSEARQDPAVPVSPMLAGTGPVAIPVWQAGMDERAVLADYRSLWAVLVAATGAMWAKGAVRALGVEPFPARSRARGPGSSG